ncbi:Uncharacterized protein PCOAH_00048180 [Plasmodium coatneyi]|uniref:Plasmodium RESA N-terminal domain-containing protein n=1 Tax=Plasmodium coatneyi TaxID=208452 RepID=A0A1B1E6H4_9APIC|nr:Uncharacterized protein PCOAH_00048180 [Plasmodium coatneyi]ANQ10611.1 Uncharacterized protein PCOAH_00048180 [Plasmodium coatneyi]
MDGDLCGRGCFHGGLGRSSSSLVANKNSFKNRCIRSLEQGNKIITGKIYTKIARSRIFILFVLTLLNLLMQNMYYNNEEWKSFSKLEISTNGCSRKLAQIKQLRECAESGGQALKNEDSVHLGKCKEQLQMQESLKQVGPEPIPSCMEKEDKITTVNEQIHFDEPEKTIQKGNTPNTSTKKGTTANRNTQKGNTPNTNPQKGNTPNTNTQKGKTPNTNTQKGNTPNTNTQKGKTPNTNTQKGNTPNTNTKKGTTANRNTQKGNTPNTNTKKGTTANRNTQKGNTPNTNPQKGNTPNTNPQKGNTPNTNTQKGNTPNTNTKKGTTANRNPQKGNTPNTNTQKGNTPNTNTKKGTTANRNTQKGNTPNTNPQKGNTPNTNTQKGNEKNRIMTTAELKEKYEDVLYEEISQNEMKEIFDFIDASKYKNIQLKENVVYSMEDNSELEYGVTMKDIGEKITERDLNLRIAKLPPDVSRKNMFIIWHYVQLFGREKYLRKNEDLWKMCDDVQKEYNIPDHIKRREWQEVAGYMISELLQKEHNDYLEFKELVQNGPCKKEKFYKYIDKKRKSWTYMTTTMMDSWKERLMERLKSHSVQEA